MTISHATSNTIVLDMKERVLVDHTNIQITDVVNSISGEETIVDQVKNLVVLKLGNTVHYKKVNKNIISAVIKSSTKNMNVIFTGSLNTIVKVKTQSYSLSFVVDDIVRDISNKISLISDNYSVKRITGNKELTVPAGSVSYRYTLPETLLKKRIPIWADIYVDSVRYQSIPLWFDVKAIAEVPVVTTAVSIGQSINKSHISMEKRDITRIKNLNLHKFNMSDLRVRKNLKVGEVLTRSMLENIPPVCKGQSVKVIASYGNVSIQVNGFSLDDGKIGQRVRVKRSGSNRVFNAVVKNEGLVSAVGS